QKRGQGVGYRLPVGALVRRLPDAAAGRADVERRRRGRIDGDAEQHAERAITAFARGSNRALIVTASPLVLIHRDLIITLSARHKLPAIYSDRAFISDGGLISYGTDYSDLYRRAAGYVDRILKGERPAHLPVQYPTKYELVINLKTAKALGLDIPATVF